MSRTPLKTPDIKRPIWAEKWGVEKHGEVAPLPPLRCRRILSKQGMECTPVFHNLFPHSSPLHVYKQSPEEDEKERERESETEEEEEEEEEKKCTGALEICQGKAV